MVCRSSSLVRRTLIKLKKRLKKKTETIDKLTDLLSRYDKQLIEKVRKFFRSLSHWSDVINEKIDSAWLELNKTFKGQLAK